MARSSATPRPVVAGGAETATAPCPAITTTPISSGRSRISCAASTLRPTPSSRRYASCTRGAARGRGTQLPHRALGSQREAQYIRLVGASAGFPTRPKEPAGLRSVTVVTDRVVLDQQLQDTIYPLEHKRGVVQKIDDRSRQLPEAFGKCGASDYRHAAEVPVRLAAIAQARRRAGRERRRYVADAALRRDHRRGAQLPRRRDRDQTQI